MAAANASGVPLIAKLERPQAIAHLDEILLACDAVMVARGDLGLEMPLESVPRAQKDITRAARRHGIPVIVATQVLESMTKEARPTRAEVNDAANAVEDGVDAIMLAGETAAGAYPARAVQTLDAIIRDAEGIAAAGRPDARRGSDPRRPRAGALRSGGDPRRPRRGAGDRRGDPRRHDGAASVGASAARAHRRGHRESADGATAHACTGGVVPLCIEIGDNLDAAGTRIGAQLVRRGLTPAGAAAVFVSISADLTRHDANYLRIQRI